MIGMDFLSFLILLVISAIISWLLQFVCKYYIVPGWGSYISRVVIGWIGAWLGSPVLGHWGHPLCYNEVYIIPAILGSIGILIFAVDFMKTCAALCMGGKEAVPKKEG